jgi:ubiquinone/menaquinone biosynthesis C-methylase UbiE
MSRDDPVQFGVDVGDAVASAWEQHRERIFESFRPVSEWLVDEVRPEPGQTVLELAAGPGETGFLAAERVGPEGRLISTDLAPAMVEAARRGAQARGLGNVECRVMDAQRIELADASVDAVISRFGLMLVPDPAQSLREARRVLRPGGRLAYAVLGAPDRNPWISMFMAAVAEAGHAPPGGPSVPGGPFSLSEPERNRELLRGAGFAEVRVEEMAGVMRYDSFGDYWAVQSSIGGPLALLIASLPADEVEALGAALESKLAPFRSGDAYELPSLAVVASATL